MSEEAELQAEELEVLRSIYEGDSCYTSPSDTKHQYKFGEDGASRSFIIEVAWGEEYPNQLPNIDMDSFYNKHLLQQVKEHVKKAVTGKTCLAIVLSSWEPAP